MWLRQRGASCELFPWSLKLYTYPPSMEKIKNAWSFDFVACCAFIPHFSTGDFDIYFKITGMCSLLLCLHLEQPVSGSEGGGGGGSQVMQNTGNFFMLCLVCSQLGAGHGNTSPWLGSNVMSAWGIRCCTKVSFKNKFSFFCLYFLCKWLCQESQVQVSPCQLSSQ